MTITDRTPPALLLIGASIGAALAVIAVVAVVAWPETVLDDLTMRQIITVGVILGALAMCERFRIRRHKEMMDAVRRTQWDSIAERMLKDG